jgi:hypothetical protein
MNVPSAVVRFRFHQTCAGTCSPTRPAGHPATTHDRELIDVNNAICIPDVDITTNSGPYDLDFWYSAQAWA